MGRPPCCDKTNVKKGPWTPEEDAKILAYVANHGIGNWTLVPEKAGLNRCGKSCRLRWTNYLRPDLKHDTFTPQEEEQILMLHKAVGSRWSYIAKQLQGRTDNDVKNHWNTKLSKKLSKMGIDPITHKPYSQIFSDIGNITGYPNTRNQITPFHNINFLNNNTLNTPPSMISKQESLHFQSQFPNTPTILNQPMENFGQFQISNPLTSFTESSSSSSYSCYQTPDIQMVPSASVWTDFLLAKDLKGEEDVQNGTEECDFRESEIGGSDSMSGCEIKKSCEKVSSSSSPSRGDLDSFVEAMLNRDNEMQMEFPFPLDVYFDY